jgi:hypothetical protein
LDPQRGCGGRIKTWNEAHNSSIQNAQAWHCTISVSLADMSAPAETSAGTSPSPQLFDFTHTNMHPFLVTFDNGFEIACLGGIGTMIASFSKSHDCKLYG